MDAKTCPHCSDRYWHSHPRHRFIVLAEDDEEGDGRKVCGDFPEDAAERWAEEYDPHNDCIIINGEQVGVKVYNVEDGIEDARTFVVTGEVVPAYYANEV